MAKATQQQGDRAVWRISISRFIFWCLWVALGLYFAIDTGAAMWWILIGWQARELFAIVFSRPLFRKVEEQRDRALKLCEESQRRFNELLLQFERRKRLNEDQELIHRSQLMALAVREQMGARPVVPNALREQLIRQAKKCETVLVHEAQGITVTAQVLEEN